MTPRYKNENRMRLMGETRQRLIKAAVDEFANEGFDGASINRITQSAGVATGTIYNYFPSKNELLLTLLSEIGAEHCSYITEQICQESDYVLRLKRLLAVAFDYVKANPNQAKVLFASMQGVNRQLKTQLSHIYEPMMQLICEEILIPGMQQGVFHPADPVSTSIMIMTFYLGVGSTVDENGVTPLDMDAVADFVLRALGVNRTSVMK
ncbi:MAG: TetR/AcrR family transcriptional regulator [Anaerolineaceae bacterium]|nr:TetR/AcrR family transcriptional regulator [Anaerolineaceae bacterium]